LVATTFSVSRIVVARFALECYHSVAVVASSKDAGQKLESSDFLKTFGYFSYFPHGSNTANYFNNFIDAFGFSTKSNEAQQTQNGYGVFL